MHRARLFEFLSNIATTVNNAEGAESCARFNLGTFQDIGTYSFTYSKFRLVNLIVCLYQSKHNTCQKTRTRFPIRSTRYNVNEVKSNTWKPRDENTTQ